MAALFLWPRAGARGGCAVDIADLLAVATRYSGLGAGQSDVLAELGEIVESAACCCGGRITVIDLLLRGRGQAIALSARPASALPRSLGPVFVIVLTKNLR